MSGYSATALAACYWFADGSGNEASSSSCAYFAAFRDVWRECTGDLCHVRVDRAFDRHAESHERRWAMVTIKTWMFGELSRLPLSPVNASLLGAGLFVACMFVVAWLLWRKANHPQGLTMLRVLFAGIALFALSVCCALIPPAPEYVAPPAPRNSAPCGSRRSPTSIGQANQACQWRYCVKKCSASSQQRGN